ncbi:MAG: mechanosensitive ion channel protein MscS [Candidatus Magasanikbacteria bacterium CG10_big_fil_rev_8_21_14_0_10_47_10]|uniref:Mechanosensitive ion channel protein MscS n=1 Tax=Candidatus Magasanikbacteria bacterium CG10_big_fil_rev_8_21_14_0_10_47_10 TaxID=1974652 RepID=A0A2H0TRK1_9BACT|nr:MAG: mechanosensitive ion channel protein MscS [Candidatus Magasanikbacteria bacterium CG10_big_fil_rev_8_21_14_0_10_47_10]
MPDTLICSHMLHRLVIFIALATIAGLTWFTNLRYENIDLAKLSYSFTAITASYFFFKLLMEEAIAKRIKQQKTRYTFRKTTQLLFLVVAFIIILRIWIINPQALLVAYGLFAAGVAISLQDVFKNFAGAMTIFISGLYQVGDRIEINSKYGDVIDIGLFYTTLLELREWVDGDQATGRITLVPNGHVLALAVHNYTKDHRFIWDEMSLPITYSSNWKKAIELVETIVKKETAAASLRAEKEISQLAEKYFLSKRNIEPKIYITPTDNWITLRVRYVVETRDRRVVQNDLLKLILDIIQQTPDIAIASQTLTITGDTIVKK